MEEINKNKSFEHYFEDGQFVLFDANNFAEGWVEADKDLVVDVKKNR